MLTLFNYHGITSPLHESGIRCAVLRVWVLRPLHPLVKVVCGSYLCVRCVVYLSILSLRGGRAGDRMLGRTFQPSWRCDMTNWYGTVCSAARNP
jgi:hypothetical protein